MTIVLPPVSRRPEWLEVAKGTKVLVMPASTPVIYAARAQADAMFAQLKEADEVVTKAGGHIVGVLDLSDAAAVEATKLSLFVIALAEVAIIGWDGVCMDVGAPDDDPVPLAFDAAHISNLMSVPGVADAFIGQYYHPLHGVIAEGNA